MNDIERYEAKKRAFQERLQRLADDEKRIAVKKAQALEGIANCDKKIAAILEAAKAVQAARTAEAQ